MIEQYFKVGMRLKWTKPRDNAGPADGSVCTSRGAANLMTYDGMDDKVVSPVSIANFSYITKNLNIQHGWLDYAPGRTAVVKMGRNDILTGYMSGCLLATYEAEGARFAAHVGTIDGNAAKNNAVRHTFGADLAANATGFNPASAWADTEVRAALPGLGTRTRERIFGIITTEGAFYSLLLGSLVTAQDEWVVAGLKPCQGMPNAQLKKALMEVAVA
ncbi:MAG: hypothetical protein AAFP13_00270 [Pseudomonadota bacterium]